MQHRPKNFIWIDRDKFARLVKKLRAAHEREGDPIDDLEVMLEENQGSDGFLPSESSAFPVSRRRPRRPKTDPGIQRILELEAEEGINTFAFELLSSGKVSLSINSRTVLLSRQLGALLILLCDTTPTQVDPNPTRLIAWKDADELRLLLRSRHGRQYSRKSFWNCVLRLRAKLLEANINKYFVQTTDRGLVRLALRQK